MYRVDAGSDIKKPTQILSTLFPQTSPSVDAEEQAREQKKKKEEEDEKQEREKSWKRMKLGYFLSNSIQIRMYNLSEVFF